MRLFAALCLLPLACAWGQDERRIVSPDGKLELRIFISQPEDGGLSRLAYRVLREGKPLVDTSYLGLNIHNQEPFLGEKAGLIGAKFSESAASRCLVAHYMQNGSIGRLIDVEARIWNDGVAFRYIIPPSTALDEILVDDELTEFAIPGAGRPRNAPLPFHAGAVWIAEVPRPPYPQVTLGADSDGVLSTRLARPNPDAVTAFEARTPLVGPWRVIALNEAALAPILLRLAS